MRKAHSICLLIILVQLAFVALSSPAQDSSGRQIQSSPGVRYQIPQDRNEGFKLFKETLIRDFPIWANGNDTLSLRRVGFLERDPLIVGRDAAVLGIIAQHMNGKIHRDQGMEPNMTLSELLDSFREDGTGQHFINILKELSGDTTYDGALRLFGRDGQISSDTAGIYQSAIGDCYALSAIESTLAFAGPSYIQNLISSNGGNSFTVSFPGARALTFALTESEIAQGNIDIEDRGCWLQVLNKAINILLEDKVKLSRKREKRRKQQQYAQTDMGYLNLGGGNRQVIYWLFRKQYTQVFRHREELWNEDSISRLISRTARAHLPICIYTADHDLAIVGWNENTREVTILNPWGTTGHYRPRKDADLFQMTNGRFTVTVRQLMDNFRGINFPEEVVLGQ